MLATNKSTERNLTTHQASSDVRVFRPLTDIIETENDYQIRSEFPGVEKDQVNIKMEKNQLLISAERKANYEIKEEKYYRIERSFGLFKRTFLLPEDSNLELVTASFENGLLLVTIPKKAEVKPRAIEIN